jgi:hypothetical protein
MAAHQITQHCAPGWPAMLASETQVIQKVVSLAYRDPLFVATLWSQCAAAAAASVLPCRSTRRATGHMIAMATTQAMSPSGPIGP